MAPSSPLYHGPALVVQLGFSLGSQGETEVTASLELLDRNLPPGLFMLTDSIPCDTNNWLGAF